MIHLLHIIGDLGTEGGTARKLVYLLKHSDRARFQHNFVCMMGGKFVAELERFGGVVTTVNSDSPIKLIGAIIKVIKQSKPDVIATHFTRAFFCGMLVARMFNLPVVHHEHGPATLDKLHRSPGKIIGKMFRRAWLPRANAIICNSNYTKTACATMFSVAQNLLHVVYNPVERRIATGVDAVPANDSPDMIVKSNTLSIGHVGGLTHWRDQATLIRAIDVLRRRGWNAQLQIIGDGNMRPALESLSVQLGLQQWVVFKGYQADLSSFYADIEVYVNPALAEGFGIAVVEAMLEYKPVVLADAGAHPELITDGITGLLYKASDADHLADCIESLKVNPAGMRNIAHTAYEHAQQTFAPHRYVNSYHAIITEVLFGAQAKANEVSVKKASDM